jgi:hypothetical protein
LWASNYLSSHKPSPKSEAFHIMKVAGMNPIKLFEDFLHIFFLDTDTIVGNRYHYVVVRVVPCACTLRAASLTSGLLILHGIVHQVEDYVCQMHLVGKDLRISPRSSSRSYLSRHNVSTFSAKVLITPSIKSLALSTFFFSIVCCLIEHRHLQHFLYLEPQSLRLIVNDTVDMMLEHRRRLCHSRGLSTSEQPKRL